MRFTVVWVAAAERELAEIWLSAGDRLNVTEATYEIDQRLRVKPDLEGESRDAGRRILLITPLGVTFEVLPNDQLVRILDVWRFQSRG